MFIRLPGLVFSYFEDLYCKFAIWFQPLFQKVDSSADAVMLGRMFLNDERNQLKEDRRLASENPGLFYQILLVVVILKIMCHCESH